MDRIRTACVASGRDASAARLLAVSKTVPVDTIAYARSLGLREFGESYLQEALPKIAALAADGRSGISSGRCSRTRHATSRLISIGSTASTG